MKLRRRDDAGYFDSIAHNAAIYQRVSRSSDAIGIDLRHALAGLARVEQSLVGRN